MHIHTCIYVYTCICMFSIGDNSAEKHNEYTLRMNNVIKTSDSIQNSA